MGGTSFHISNDMETEERGREIDLHMDMSNTKM